MNTTTTPQGHRDQIWHQYFQTEIICMYDMEMRIWFFQGFTEIKNGRQAIFCGRKNSKIEVRNNVQVILLKFYMATTSRLLKYVWRQKIQSN